MDRTKFIGSSDIAGILGLSRWTTPLKIWAQKTGEVEPDDLSEKEYVEWGTRLEEVVAKKFAEKNNVKLIAYKKRYTHKDYPYMTCELDRLIAGTDEILEIKTANAWKLKEWKETDEIPQEYIIQILWAMGISGRKRAHIAVLIGGNKYLEKRVEFDADVFEDMVQKAKHFWEVNVKGKVMPMAVADDNELMVDLYPENATEEMVEANEEIERAVALLQETKLHLTEMKKEKDGLEAKIKTVIGEATGLVTKKYRVTWKKQFKKAYTVKESETRVLRVTKQKEESDGKNK